MTTTTTTPTTTCGKLNGSWKCQRAKGHDGRHGTIPDWAKVAK